MIGSVKGFLGRYTMSVSGSLSGSMSGCVSRFVS